MADNGENDQVLKQRIITAVVLAAVLLWALFDWSDSWYGLLLLAATVACAWEWSALGNLSSFASRCLFSAAVTFSALVVIWFGGEPVLKPLLLIVVLLWIAIVLDLFVRPKIMQTDSEVRWSLLLLAAVILIVSVAALFWLRSKMSAWFIVYIVTLVAAADTGAYFSGRKFGNRKLAVQISSGKTIEGAIGGMAAAILLAAVTIRYLSNDHSSSIAIFIFSVLAALFSIAGDLFISRAKRTAGVKDSGNLLPGHGGVLDRFDGLLAAVPWMAFAILWM